jgi:hypothetical protein
MAAVLWVAGCASSSFLRLTPTQLDRAARRWPEETPENFERGRNLYLAKCSGCHALVLPQERSADQWPAIVNQMEPLAKISDEERDRILRFILAASEK